MTRNTLAGNTRTGSGQFNPQSDGLMTIGSPLGIDEVQDFFPKWVRENGFPTDKLRGPWVNVFDPLDVVACADPYIANDYQLNGKPVIEDLREDNWGVGGTASASTTDVDDPTTPANVCAASFLDQTDDRR